MDVSQRIAVSGLLAHQRQLEVTGNNVANANTPSFKRARVGFADIGYQAGLTAPVGPGGANVRLTGVGEGVQMADIRHEFEPGPLETTGKPLDLALQGDGFFVVSQPDGQPGYTRDGAFGIDAGGQIVSAAGYPVQSTDGQALVVPDNATAIRADELGQVFVTIEGAPEETLLGRLALVRFPNNQGLLANGQNTWLATDASGQAEAIGENADAPLVVSGALEASNVAIADEFTRMIQAQRGYQLNLRVVQAWDDVERMANELRR